MDPANGSNNAERSPLQRTILLNVLSVSTGVPDKLTFSELPTSTTIGGLKSKIQDAVATKPPPGRQRLIYRGKALGQQDMTLETLFGSEAIENAEPLTLHLVVTPLPNSNGPSLAASFNPPRIQPQQPAGLPHLPRSQSPQVPRPFGAAQMPMGNPPNVAHNLPPAVPFNNQWQPHPFFQAVPNILNNHFATFGQMQHPLAGQMPAQGYPNLGQHPTQQPFPSFAQAGAQQNARAMPEQSLPQASHTSQDQNSVATEQQSMPNTQNPQSSRSGTPSLPGTLGNPSTTVVREGQMPGAQWRVVINQTVIPIPNNNAQQAPVSNGGSSSGHIMRRPQAQNQEQHQQATSQAQETHTDANVEGQQQPSAASMNPSMSQDPMVYLLSSPNGPEALVTSPLGAFASPGFHNIPNHNASTRLPTSALFFPHQGFQSQANPGNYAGQANQAHQVNQANQNNQPVRLPHGVNIGIPPQPNQAQEARQDQVADLLRIFLQNGGHLWLLIRLCGFLYLFTGGVGWYRTILIMICTVVAFAAQTGWFQPLLEVIWNPVRRHIEGLIQVEQRDANRNGNAAAGERATDNGLTPQQMAERLVRERDERDAPLFRSMTRRIERAVALFVASLIPGVGEQHIAAREAAARQERERREAAEREEEQRRQASDEQGREQAGGGENTDPANTAAITRPEDDHHPQEAVMTGAL